MREPSAAVDCAGAAPDVEAGPSCEAARPWELILSVKARVNQQRCDLPGLRFEEHGVELSDSGLTLSLLRRREPAIVVSKVSSGPGGRER